MTFYKCAFSRPYDAPGGSELRISKPQLSKIPFNLSANTSLLLLVGRRSTQGRHIAGEVRRDARAYCAAESRSREMEPNPQTPHAGSAQGISPRAAHRPGREPLDSSGSCHPEEAHRLPPRQGVHS